MADVVVTAKATMPPRRPFRSELVIFMNHLPCWLHHSGSAHDERRTANSACAEFGSTSSPGSANKGGFEKGRLCYTQFFPNKERRFLIASCLVRFGDHLRATCNVSY